MIIYYGIFFTILYLLIFAYLINSASNQYVNKLEKLFLVYVWFCSFFPFIFIPIEISLTIQSKMDDDVINGLTLYWKLYYYINFFNGWISLPMITYYIMRGDFTFGQKLKSSCIKYMNFFLLSFGCALIVYLILLLLGKIDFNFKKLIETALTLYNSLFIFLYLIVLSYGLAKVPKIFLKKINMKNYTYQRIENLVPINKTYEKQLLIINCLYEAYQKTRISYIVRHKREYEEIGQIFDEVVLVRRNIDAKHQKKLKKLLRELDGTLKSLVYFNELVKKAVYMYQQIRQKVIQSTMEISYNFYILDQVLGPINTDGYSYISESQQDFFEEKGCIREDKERERIYYQKFYKPFHILLTVIFSLMSFIIISLEIIYIIKPTFLDFIFKETFKYFKTPFPLMLFIEPFLLYMFLCVYFFIFKLNIQNAYGIKLNRQTNLMTLLYTSSLLTYFTFPMANNFYNLFMNSSESSFQRSFGQIKQIKLGGLNLLDYFPVFLIIQVLLIWFDLDQQIKKKIDEAFFGTQAQSEIHDRDVQEYDLKKKFGKILEQAKEDYQKIKSVENLGQFNQYSLTILYKI